MHKCNKSVYVPVVLFEYILFIIGNFNCSSKSRRSDDKRIIGS